MSEAPAAAAPPQNGTPVEVQPEEAPSFKVFAGNLSYATTDEGLKTFFAPVESEILTAQVIQRGHRSAGYGFVAFNSAETAIKAVELLHKQELDGREVIVELAKPADQKDKERKERKPKRRPGRRGTKPVPGEVSEAEANGEAKPEGDSTAPAPSKPKKKKKSKAKKAKKEDAPADVPAEEGAAPAAPKKKTPKRRAPRPPRPAGEDPVGEPSKSMLFVANLGFTIDDNGLSTLFTDANITVNSARIVRRRWGQPRKSKGYGFVDVGSEEEQKKAISALDGKDVGGRPIAVKVAVNTPPEESDAEAKTDAPAAAPVGVETDVTPAPAA